ncbi:MAG: DNA (cytosine-5-)-methyltransferase [Methanosphaera sp. rholeuAM130]|nr:MAG: DNA (cytosine-5-)-methyltransferase [Methanosphaera sp. rholeuAM130]
MHRDNMYTTIELFAGAGGLALGLEKSGLKHELLVEIDKDCVNTLQYNRPEWNVIHDDIKNVDFNGFEDIDIVTGGFPCQAFSYAGKRLGFEDTRGTLFFEFARCVKEVKPQICVAENVQGLVRHDKGRTLQTMIDVLESLGYTVQYKVLNSWNYGVAQKRKRMFLVGTLKKIPFTYPKELSFKPTLKDALKDVPPSEGISYSKSKKEIMELVPPGGCWVDLPDDIQKEYMGKSYYSGGGKRGMARRLSWDEPSLTLTTSPAQKQTERCHPDETRPFTVREYARIQSFPDEWKFCGKITSQYKQIGNAVPVKLGEAMGKSIIEYLNNEHHDKSIQTTLTI